MVLSKDRVPGVLLALDRFSHEGHIKWRSEEALAIFLVTLVVVGPLAFAVAVANRPSIPIATTVVPACEVLIDPTSNS